VLKIQIVVVFFICLIKTGKGFFRELLGLLSFNRTLLRMICDRIVHPEFAGRIDIVMKVLYFATSNKWKFRQAEKYFAEKEINLEQFAIDLPESRSEEGVEIAREKARYAWKKVKQPLFVLDASFCVKALNDFPKSYVKFMDKYIGAEGLLKLMGGKRDRRWELLNVLFYKNGRVERAFVGVQEGAVSGKLTHNKRGKLRDFDRVLVPKGYNKTFAEFTDEEVKEYDEKIWRPGVFDEFIGWLRKNGQDGN